MASAINKLTAACDDFQQAADPLAAVEIAQQVGSLAEKVQHEAVRAARQQGVSWSKIGAVFGLSKQGAQQRFGKHKNADAG
ncbi:hypothetical protein [Enemella sp. A6]|uniref:hypothetical protein n=1 Tax=Enemella sp. A6 TaxID=3440152 RepID=UPI003EBC069F